MKLTISPVFVICCSYIRSRMAVKCTKFIVSPFLLMISIKDSESTVFFIYSVIAYSLSLQLFLNNAKEKATLVSAKEPKKTEKGNRFNVLGCFLIISKVTAFFIKSIFLSVRIYYKTFNNSKHFLFWSQLLLKNNKKMITLHYYLRWAFQEYHFFKGNGLYFRTV